MSCYYKYNLKKKIPVIYNGLMVNYIQINKFISILTDSFKVVVTKLNCNELFKKL